MNENQLTELVTRAISKDNQAMEMLYKAYYRDVLYVCKRLNLNDADANDITQDSFIDAFSKLNMLNDKSKFKQWVCRIANNKACNLLKRNNILKFDNIDDDSFFEIPDKEKTAETQVIENEISNILKSIIEKLPLEQRITVFMFYYEDMSVKEIAQAYGISENTVRSRLNYAKKFITYEINKLEDNGIKLRCTAILPFLYLLFANECNAFAASIPENAIPTSSSIIAKVMKGSAVTTVPTSVTTASTTASTSINTTATSVAATVTKTGFSLGKIIAISSATIAVIASVIVGIVLLGNNDNDDNNTSSKDYISSETNKNTDKDSNNSDDNNTDSKETTENNTEEKNDYSTGDEYWDYYYVEPPTLPEINYSEIEYLKTESGPIIANIADTIFDFTPEQIIDKLKSTSIYPEKSFIYTIDSEEECKVKEFDNVGVQKQFNIINTVKAYSKNRVNEITSNPDYQYTDFNFQYDVNVRLERDITNYNNYNKITIGFDFIDVNRDTQKNIYTVIEDMFGKELATYMVYGTDTDERNNDTLDFLADRELGDYIKIGKSTTYFVSRDIRFIDENLGNVTFIVYVTHKNENKNCYYVGDYTSYFESEEFLNTYIKGDFGSTDINDLRNFGSKYMEYGLEDEYVKTMSDGYTYKVLNYPDMTTSETLSLDVQKGCSNVANLIAPELYTDIDFLHKDGKLLQLNVRFKGDVGLASAPDDTETDYTVVYEPLVSKLKAILGDSVDLSTLDMATFLEKKEINFETNYLDMPCNGSITYSFGINAAELLTGKFEIKISLNK